MEGGWQEKCVHCEPCYQRYIGHRHTTLEEYGSGEVGAGAVHTVHLGGGLARYCQVVAVL